MHFYSEHLLYMQSVPVKLVAHFFKECDIMILVDLQKWEQHTLISLTGVWGAWNQNMHGIYLHLPQLQRYIYIKLYEIFLVNLWILHQPLFLIMYLRRTKMWAGWKLDDISSILIIDGWLSSCQCLVCSLCAEISFLCIFVHFLCLDLLQGSYIWRFYYRDLFTPVTNCNCSFVNASVWKGKAVMTPC